MGEPIKFDCAVCGVEWESKVNRQGARYCGTCVELRRSLNGFVNRGLTVEEVKTRATKILELAVA